MQHKGMKEMSLVDLVNLALLMPIFLNMKPFLRQSFETVLFRWIRRAS